MSVLLVFSDDGPFEVEVFVVGDASLLEEWFRGFG